MAKRKSTRNAQGSGTIRQRKDGRWEARYTTGRDPGTGKQIQKSVYGETQSEVRKKLAQATTAIDEGIFLEPSKLTVGAWLDIWLDEYVENAVKPLTYHSYKVQCNYHIKPALAAIKLSALSPHSIQKFYNDLQKGKNNKPGLSAKTIKNIHGVLHKALKQAVKLSYIKNNPSDSCSIPRVIKKDIKPLQQNDIQAFLIAIKGHKFEMLFKVALFTGVRQGEILGMTWDCIDFNKNTILINKQLQKKRKDGIEYVLVPSKNNKARLLSPAVSVMSALKVQKKMQLELRIKAGFTWSESNLVFTDEIGNCLKHITVYNHFKKTVKSIGLPNARFHDLRHSYAVAALQSGDDVKTVQENLGHHTAAFTLDVYGHVTDKMKQDSADRMERFINSVLSL